MSERLTDDNIAALQRIVDGDDGVRPIMFPWIDRALSEIRQHRAAALTAEEVEALQTAHSIVSVHHAAGRWPCADCAPALAVLDKLIAGKEGK